MNSRNETVKNCARMCCSWGNPTVPTTSSREYKGGPVPQLINPVKDFSRYLTIMNVIFTVIAFLQSTTQYVVNLQQKTVKEQDILNYKQTCVIRSFEANGASPAEIQEATANIEEVTVNVACAAIIPVQTQMIAFFLINTLWLFFVNST